MHQLKHTSHSLLYSLLLLYTDTLDYIFSPTTFQFQPAAHNEPIPSTVLSISIIRDPDNELNETFQLTIGVYDEARASNIFEGEISMTVVLIKDDDSKTKAILPSVLINKIMQIITIWDLYHVVLNQLTHVFNSYTYTYIGYFIV